MKHKRQSVHKATEFKQRLLCVAVASAFGGAAHANPTGPQVVNGQVSFAQQGNTLAITNSPNAIINWQSFSIGTSETTRFLQQNASSAVLNRVVGIDPSVILGTLQSNGKVFLINPSGVLFGQGSRIDVAGLVASTLNMSDQDFLAGRLNFATGAINAGGVTNQGTITTPSGGSVILVAPQVENSGIINAPNGDVILAAGRSVRLGDTGAPNVLVEIQAPDNQAINVGEIVVGGGRASIYAGLISQKGVVRADSVSVNGAGRIVFKATKDVMLAAGSLTSANGTNGGHILVQAEQGTNLVHGKVTAIGTSGVGGGINLLGAQVGVVGDARVDASGSAGGGTILVGGDYKGGNVAIQNARATFFGSDAMLVADATDAGNGGRIILWSDEVTRAYGQIGAKGGATSGNGGFVETSSRGYLEVTAAPDLSAPNGIGGTWLIDPWDIIIDNTTQFITSTGIDPITLASDSTNTPSTAPSLLNAATISTALSNGTSVIVDTAGTGPQAGNIVVDALIEKTDGGDASLTLKANKSIYLTGTAGIGSSFGALNVTLNADQDGVDGGAVSLNSVSVLTNGGDLVIGGGANPLTGFVTSAADATYGDINNGVWMSASTISAGAGDITINGATNWAPTLFGDGVTLGNGTSIQTTTGNILIRGTATARSGDVAFASGVRVDFNAQILSDTGIIQIHGTGAGIPGAPATTGTTGIVLQKDALVQVTGAGRIELDGTGGTSASTLQAVEGVMLLDRASILADSSGVISITGRIGAAGGGSIQNGIGMNSDGFDPGVTVRAGGDGGSITLTGLPATGGTVIENANGIAMQGAGTLVQATGNATITVNGTGSDTSIENGFAGTHGLLMFGGANIQSEDGAITITGTGGLATPTGIGTTGVTMFDAGTKITTTDGAIQITGFGGGTLANPTGQNASGVQLGSGAVIEAMGSGSVSITGTAGVTQGIFDPNNLHFFAAGANSTYTDGVNINSYGSASETLVLSNTGSITIVGNGAQILNDAVGTQGVFIGAPGSAVQSVSGDISITGTGGGTPDHRAGGDTLGVLLFQGVGVATGGAGTVQITGTGGATSGGISIGVSVYDGSRVSAHDGSIVLTGVGGQSTNTFSGRDSFANHGVEIGSDTDSGFGSDVVAQGNGSILIQGVAGNAAGGANIGVTLRENTLVEAAGTGSITLQGQLTTAAYEDIASDIVGDGNNGGVSVTRASIVRSGAGLTTGGGAITIVGLGPTDGTGASAAPQLFGVRLADGAWVDSVAGGAINISGDVRDARTAGMEGVGVHGSIITGGSANVSLTGVGGATNIAADGVFIIDGLAPNIEGVYIAAPSLVETTSGSITITGSLNDFDGASNVSGVTVFGNVGGLGTAVQSVTGEITIDGTGPGTSAVRALSDNQGVVIGEGAIVQTTGGSNVVVTGYAGAATDGNLNGVLLLDGGRIGAGLTGSVFVTGYAGDPGLDSTNSSGIAMNGGSGIHVIDGNVSLTGYGPGWEFGGGALDLDAAAGARSVGVYIGGTSSVGAFDTGNVSVIGKAGAVNGIVLSGVLTGDSSGVNVDVGSSVFTNSGLLTIDANGGTFDAGASVGAGVSIRGTVQTTNGAIQITGDGATGGSHDLSGVYVGPSGLVTDSDVSGLANISIVGRAGTVSSGQSSGIVIDGGAVNSYLSAGTVLLSGFGAASDNTDMGPENHFNDGVVIFRNGSVSVTGGTRLRIDGVAGNSAGGSNVGVVIAEGGSVRGENGLVTVIGNGGTGGSQNDGVFIGNGISQLGTTGSGAIQIIGTAGLDGGVLPAGRGVTLWDGGIVSSDSGSIAISGIAGTVSGSGHLGVVLESGSSVRADGGNVAVNATGGNVEADELSQIRGNSVSLSADEDLTVNGSVTALASGINLFATAGQVIVGSGTSFSTSTGIVNLNTPTLFLASDFTIPASGWAFNSLAGKTIDGATPATTLSNLGTLALSNTTVNTLLNNQGAIKAFSTNNLVQAALDNLGTITVEPGGSLVLSGAASNAASGTIVVTANDGAGSTSFSSMTVSGTLDNAGTVELRSDASNGFNASLIVGSTGTVKNSGTIRSMLTGTGTSTPTSFINPGGTNGTLVNTGTLQADSPTTISLATFDNQGTVLIAAGPGSTINGALSNSSTGAIRVSANNILNNATLTVASGFTNAGRIELEAASNGGVGIFNLSSGALANAATGVIRSQASGVTTASNQLNASVTNLGLIDVAQDLAVTGALTISNTASGTVLTGAGNLTVSGAATLSGGTMTGTGSTITQGALTVSGSIGLDAGRVLDIQGGASWTAGSINLNSSGPGSGRIINRAGSLFDTSFDGAMFANSFGGADDGTSALFSNAGTFTKSAGTGITTIQNPFNNSGTVNVDSGTLTMAGGSTHTGSDIQGAGTIQFSTGTHDLDAASSLTTANAQFSSGTVNMAGTYNVSGTTEVIGSTANLTGTLTSLGAALNLSGGAVDFSGADATVTTFTQSGGLLSGTGDLTVSGAATLSGGTMTGTGSTITQGALTVSGSIGLDAGRVLDIQGGASWTAGSINLNSSGPGSGRIINRAGSLFDTSFDGAMFANSFGGADDGTSALFSNAGTFTKSAGTGITTIQNPFNNSGTVNVDSGTLTMAGGSTHTGSDIQGAGTIQFSTGTHDLDAASSLTTANAQFSSGTVNMAGTYNVSGTTEVIGSTANLTGTLTSLGAALNLSGGAVDFSGADATVTTFTQSGGLLSGTGDLTVSGAATLSGGTMTGTGSTITQGALTVSGSIGLDAGRVLDIQGGASWTAGSINLNSSGPGSGRIINRAGSLFDTSFDGAMFANSFGGADDGTSALFSNAGTFTKSAGTGITTIQNPFNNSGTVNVDSGTLQITEFASGRNTGIIDLAAGATLSTGGTSLINGTTGIIRGTGTIGLGTTGTLTNEGIIRPGASPGTLTIDGNLALTSTSLIDIEIQSPGITAGTDFDVINVTGTASLGGTLSATVLGVFDPSDGQSFQVINNAASISGAFLSVILPGGFSHQVNPANVVLVFGGIICTGTICWDNSSGDDLWTNPLNWNLDVLPGISDIVVIDLGGGTFVVLDSGTHTIASLLAAEHLQISNGSLSVTGTSTFNGGLTVSGGAFTGSGAISANVVNLSSGSIDLVTTALFNELNMTGGVVSGAGALTVNGSLIATGGTIEMDQALSSIFVSQASGSLGLAIPIQAHSVTLRSLAGSIAGNGAITADVLDVTAASGISLNGANVLNSLSALNTTTGNIDIHVENRLLAPVGNVVLDDIVNLGGDVDLTINSALPLAYGMQSGIAYSASGSFNVSQSEMFGATVTSNGAHFGGINMGGGTNTLDTGATLIDDLVLSSTLSPATLTGNSSVTVANSFAWYGGMLSTTGTFTTNGSTSILRLHPNPPNVPVDAVLDTDWVNVAGAHAQYAGSGGGNLIINGGRTITNAGEFHINPVGAATGQIQGVGATFVNQGLLAKDTSVATQMNTHVINDGGTITSGAGTLEITDLTIQGAGLVQGVAPVVVSGAFTWTGGALASGAEIDLSGSGSIFTGASKILDGTLSNSGTLTVLDSVSGTGVLQNASQMNVASVTIQPAVINDGLLTIQPGTGTNFGTTLINGATGTISMISNVTTSSNLIVAGDVTNNGLINLQAGGAGATNAGFGVTTGTLTNNGMIRSSGDSGIFFNRLSGNIVNNGTLDVTESLRMDNEGHTFTQAGTLTIASGEQLFLNGNVSGTTLNLNSGLAIGTGAALRLFRATVNGPASLQNSGSVYLSGATNILTDVANTGAISVSGNNLGNTLVNSAAGTVSMISDTTTIANWSFTGDVANNGLINLQAGGTGATNAGFGVTTGTLTNNGMIRSSGDSGIFFNRLSGNIVNNGTLDVTESLRMDNSGKTFTNAGSGSVTIAAGETLFLNGDVAGAVLNLDNGLSVGAGATLRLGHVAVNGPGGIVNVGALNISGNTDIVGNVTNLNAGSVIEARGLGNSIGSLANAGRVSVVADSGLASLDVGTGFTNTGTIEVVAGGVADSAGFNILTGTLTNAGTIRSRTLGSSGSNGIGAAITSTGIIDTAHDLTITGGLTIPSAVTGLVATGAGTLTLNGLTVNATDVLNQPVIGGTGLLVTNGTSTINGGQLHLDTRNWNNLGTITIDGRVTLDNGAELRNEAGATLTLSGTNGAPILQGVGAPSAVINTGTFTKTGTATQAIDLAFDNGGTVNVNGGVLQFGGDGVHTGSFVASSGAELGFTGGTHELNAGAGISGAGVVRVNSTTWNANTSLSTATSFIMQNGLITGTGNLAFGGLFTLSGGTIAGAGVLTTNGTSTINNGTGQLDGRNWNNFGAMTINGRVTLDNGAVFTNGIGGTLTLAGANATPIAGGIGLPTTFNNSGTMTNASVTPQAISVATFNNSGALSVDAGSVLSVAGQFNMSGGSLSGDGDFGALGDFGWSGGTVSGAGAFSAASAQFGGGLKQLDGRSMTISGALKFGGVDWLDMSDGAVLTVSGLATLDTSAISSSFFGINSVSGAPSTVNFLGGITKLGTQPFDLAVQANTAGVVRSQAGQLAFDAGFTGTGGGTHTNTSFVTDSGAEISFSRGTHVVEGNVNFGGAGQTYIWANGTAAQFLPASGGGTLTNNGLLLIDSGATLGVDLTNAGTLTFGNSTVSGNLDNQGTINVSSGTTDLSGSLSSIVSGSVVNVNGGTLAGPGSITASVLNLSGGSLNGTGSLTVSSNFTQSGGNVGGNYQQLALAHQGDFLVQQQSYIAQDTLTVAASGSITVDGQTLSAPNVILFAGNGVTLRSSTSAQSLVDATTTLNVDTPGLVLDATMGPAKLQSAGTMDLIVGSVNVTAGAFAASIDPTVLNVSATGNIILTGGSGANSSATISGNDVTVTGANITLTGGSGSSSYAAIAATAGNATVTASNLIVMTPGTGSNSDASMVAPPGLLTVTAQSCTGCFVLQSDPLLDRGTNQGLFGSTVVLGGGIAEPDVLLDQLVPVYNSIIYAASLADTGGEANTEYSEQESESSESEEGANTEGGGSGGNDSKPRKALPACAM